MVSVIFNLPLLLSNHRWPWSTVLLSTALWTNRTALTSLLPSAPTKKISSPPPVSSPLTSHQPYSISEFSFNYYLWRHIFCNGDDIWGQIMLLVAQLNTILSCPLHPFVSFSFSSPFALISSVCSRFHNAVVTSHTVWAGFVYIRRWWRQVDDCGFFRL